MIKNIIGRNNCLPQLLRDAMLGFAVGNAMGMPYKGTKRGGSKIPPKMVGVRAKHQPAGTWSDETALSLATMASIAECGEVVPENMMRHFAEWYFHGKYSAGSVALDAERTTRRAIENYQKNQSVAPPIEGDNGNGALMRILPLAFLPDGVEWIETVAQLTHADPTSTAACQIYVAVAKALISGATIRNAVAAGQESAPALFHRLSGLHSIPTTDIHSTSYAVHTLEAALWCLLHTTNYRDTIMLAIYLGDETGTIAALAGGLAGIFYGRGQRNERIPRRWLVKLRGRRKVNAVCKKMAKAIF